MKTFDVQCLGYAVKADVYEGSSDGIVQLWLIGWTSSRRKSRFQEYSADLAESQDVTTVIFDYSGHGDSPFDIKDTRPAQHFLEVVTVYDWVREKYPGHKIVVNGSSYGGFQATQLTKYREFDGLILRAPAIYRPNDFYTQHEDYDREATNAFRHDAEALASHPLLARASKFKGKVLLMVHGNDEIIPSQTTDAYAAALNPEVYEAEGVPHSLDQATDEQSYVYLQKLSQWLATV